MFKQIEKKSFISKLKYNRQSEHDNTIATSKAFASVKRAERRE